MLEKIEYILPKSNENIELFALLMELFKNLNYVNIEDNKIQILSNLNPKTIFKLDDSISKIQINIGNEKYVDLLNRNTENNKNTSEIKKLSAKEVASKLAGHITRIDHTGINLPTNFYSEEEWNELIKYFSSISNIYSYPTGEQWPFVIPANEEENKTEITDFNITREPKFELVYDDYDNNGIQIDIETDLLKEDVEKLFPDNQGIYFESLENIFKAIYLDYSDYIDIRIDIRFKSERGNWESGKWLVCDGKRIR